jgi:hypothetical protein
MEAICRSETLVSTYSSTRRYNPEDQYRYLELHTAIQTSFTRFYLVSRIECQVDNFKQPHHPHYQFIVIIFLSRSVYMMSALVKRFRNDNEAQ